MSKNEFKGFSIQLDGDGEIEMANDAWRLLPADDQDEILESCYEVIDREEPIRIHKALHGKFYSLIVVPFYNSKDELGGISANGFPISFTLFDNVVMNNIVDIAFYVSVRDGEFYLDGVNDVMEKLTGLKKKDVLGKKVTEIVPKDSITNVLKHNYEAVDSGKTIKWEEVMTYPVGVKYFDVAVTPIFNDRGQCQALIGTAHDVTEIRKAEKETYKNFSLINAIIEGTSDYIFVKDLDSRYLMVNTSGAKLLGVSPYELIHKRDYEMFSGETAAQFVMSDREVLEDGIQRTYEEDVIINNRKYHFMSVKGVYRNLDGKVSGIFGISRDITKLKNIENELKKSNAILKATLNATADGILVLDKNHKVQMYNEKFLELWKFSKEFIENNRYEEILTKVLNQLKNPEECWDRLEELELNPLERSYDIIEFKDGRVFERYTIPQIVNNELMGRVFSYRDIGPRMKIDEVRDYQNPAM